MSRTENATRGYVFAMPSISDPPLPVPQPSGLYRLTSLSKDACGTAPSVAVAYPGMTNVFHAWRFGNLVA